MKRFLATLALLAAFLVAGAMGAGNAAAAPSQSLTLKELKDSGAQALTAEQLKAFLLKGTHNGMDAQYKDMLKFWDDGTLKSTNERNNQAKGTWSVDADGVFSMVQNWPKPERASGKAYAKDGACYFFNPDAGDASTWVYFME